MIINSDYLKMSKITKCATFNDCDIYCMQYFTYKRYIYNSSRKVYKQPTYSSLFREEAKEA